MAKRKVLVVDDEPKIIEALKSFLESKGFSVLSAENGTEALAIARKEPLSLILLDLMLPGMRGEDVCREIRKQSRVPIIMLTARNEEEDLLEGLAIGADDYITKPFSLKALFARIEAVLRRSSDDLSPLFRRMSFHNGDLEVDFESRTVRKAGADVRLTPNEFGILAALVKYPNRTFTRDDLIASVFGDEYDGFDRTVDSHIKNLRKKIETDPKEPVYVRTIHGVGYRFGGA